MGLKHRAVLVVLDGLGDRPCPAIGDMTPLQAASIPALDALAARSLCGLVDPLFPGVPVGTHTGVAVLAGVPSAMAAGLKRGPIEAIGVGLDADPAAVMMRCNFATVRSEGDELIVLDRRAGRIDAGTDELAQALDGIDVGPGIRVTVRPTTQHRGVLVLNGETVSPDITNTDPGAGTGVTAMLACVAERPQDAAAVATAVAVDRFLREAHRRLREHPVNRDRAARGEAVANGLITRGAGRPMPLESRITHCGLRAAVVAGDRTVIGLGLELGFTVLREEGFTTAAHTDLVGKVAAVEKALGDHHFVILHLKAADVLAHDCDARGKCDFLGRVDTALRPLLERTDLVIAVSGDHSTDSVSGRHSGDPVPSILYAPGGRRDECDRLDELRCVRGGLGRIPAAGFVASMLDQMGALGNYRPSERRFYGL